jgi:hypothetical protein
MTEGEWYHITFVEFATQFLYGQADKDRFRIHIHNPLEENEIKFMYAPGQEGNAGTINGLYIFYSVLNRLFRKTIYPRDGDPTNISHYAKNLLANLRDEAPPFSVIHYIWEEIKGISLNPQKKPLIPLAQVSFAPRADPAPQQQHEAAKPVRPAGYTGQTSLGDQGQSSA